MNWEFIEEKYKREEEIKENIYLISKNKKYFILKLLDSDNLLTDVDEVLYWTGKMAELGIHPKVYELGKLVDRDKREWGYIIMERIWMNLDEYCEMLARNQVSLPKRDWSEILGCIEKIHKMNVIHGDLSICNIVLGYDEKYYIIDFETVFSISDLNKTKVKNHLVRCYDQSNINQYMNYEVKYVNSQITSFFVSLEQKI